MGNEHLRRKPTCRPTHQSRIRVVVILRFGDRGKSEVCKTKSPAVRNEDIRLERQSEYVQRDT